MAETKSSYVDVSIRKKELVMKTVELDELKETLDELDFRDIFTNHMDKIRINQEDKLVIERIIEMLSDPIYLLTIKGDIRDKALAVMQAFQVTCRKRQKKLLRED